MDIYVVVIKVVGVKWVVNLSSVGVDLGLEVGVFYMYYIIE